MLNLFESLSGLPGTFHVDVFFILLLPMPVRIQDVVFGTPNGNGHMRDFKIQIGSAVIHGRVFNQAKTVANG